MSLGAYLAGVAGLAAILVSVAIAAVRLRGALVPGWSRSPARLAEIVLGTSVLTVLLQVLGLLGILDPLPLVAACGLAGLAAVRYLPRPEPGAGQPPPAPAADPVLVALALGAALLVAGRWATGLEYSWEHGMNHFDSLWYHAPFAARFAQEGSIWSLHFTDVLYLNWFYPQNSELQHTTGVLLFGRDLISPLINMGWLAITFLAAWCVGRPYGTGPVTVIAVAGVLATNMLVPREPGNAATDIAPIALLLATAAIILNARAAGGLSRGAMVVAGLASGLAVGTKLTAGATVGALTVGVAVLARQGDRLRSAAIWLAAVAATGGIWFVRNLLHSGNPLPWLTDVGPLDLPGPERLLGGRDPFSVSHYLFPPSGVDADAFLEPLRDSLGFGWPVMLGLAAVGMGLALARGRAPEIRVMGAVAITAAIAYLFTPLTASGPEGTAAGFQVNLRYVAPALVLGLALLPLDRWITPGTRSTVVTLAFIPLLMLVFLTASDSGVSGHAGVLTAVVVSFVVVAVPVGLVFLAGRSRVAALAAGTAVAVALAAAGWFKQDDYFRGRYGEGVGYGVGPAVQVADDLGGKRIALGGSAGGYFQYGFYGKDLTNHVQYVGRHESNADFLAYDDCSEWRRAVNEGEYDYLVITGNLDLNFPSRTTWAIESSWAAGDPAAERILKAGQVSVFRLGGDLDPSACHPVAQAGP